MGQVRTKWNQVGTKWDEVGTKGEEVKDKCQETPKTGPRSPQDGPKVISKMPPESTLEVVRGAMGAVNPFQVSILGTL